MDWLQIVTNIVQIIGVCWVLLFGGRAAIQVIGDFMRRRPIRQPRASTVTNVLLALILLALISLRLIPTGNTTAHLPASPTSTPATVGKTPVDITSPTASTKTTTPTPQQLYDQIAGKLVLNDPLIKQDSNDWNVASNSNFSCQFQNGTYHAKANIGYAPACPAENTTFSNFVFRVQMTILQGDCGAILFRADTAPQVNQFYFYVVCQDGSYQLYRYDKPGSPTASLARGTSSAIHTGLNQSNLVAVMAQAGNIALFVNNLYIRSVTDATYPGGQIGVGSGANSNQTDVVFSDAEVWTV